MNDPHRPTCAIFFDERSSIAARRPNRRTLTVRLDVRPFTLGCCRMTTQRRNNALFFALWAGPGQLYNIGATRSCGGQIPTLRVERCGGGPAR